MSDREDDPESPSLLSAGSDHDPHDTRTPVGQIRVKVLASSLGLVHQRVIVGGEDSDTVVDLFFSPANARLIAQGLIQAAGVAIELGVAKDIPT